jgi:hypothetical protein
MKILAPGAGVRFLAAASIGVAMSCPASAQTDNAALEQEKDRLVLEAAIEKAKADIAAHRKAQREAEALADLVIRQKEAEAKKAEAEAEKGELLAKLPATKIEALPGSIDAKNFGAAGLVVAVDLAKEIALRLCGVIDEGRTLLIYDGWPSPESRRRLLDIRLPCFRNRLPALEEPDDRKPGRHQEPRHERPPRRAR